MHLGRFRQATHHLKCWILERKRVVREKSHFLAIRDEDSSCKGRLGQSELTQLPKLSTNAPPTSKLEANTCICTFNTFASSCLLSLATDSSVSHTDEQRGSFFLLSQVTTAEASSMVHICKEWLPFLVAVIGHDSSKQHGPNAKNGFPFSFFRIVQCVIRSLFCHSHLSCVLSHVRIDPSFLLSHIRMDNDWGFLGNCFSVTAGACLVQVKTMQRGNRPPCQHFFPVTRQDGPWLQNNLLQCQGQYMHQKYGKPLGRPCGPQLLND